MTLDEARDAYLAAFRAAIEALRKLEAAQAAERKARDIYKKLWDQQMKDDENE